MPFNCWYDNGTGGTRPFGTEWAWGDGSVTPAMMCEIADSLMQDRMHEWGQLTPTTITSTPRQIIIERFLHNALDPEGEGSKIIGTIVHRALVGQLVKIGYETRPFEFMAFGRKLKGSPDGWWPRGKSKPFDWMPDIVELKVTSSGSMKFVLEDAKTKDDHEIQINLYREGYGKEHGCDPMGVSARSEYYCIPQKERVTGQGYVRMPPSVAYPVDFYPLAELGERRPGYTPPRKATDYQGPPPGKVAENVEVLGAAVDAIEAGADPHDIVRRLPCECPRKFNGNGRDYCSVAKVCAMEDHGTPMW